ncbi:carbonic anhydrase [Dactylonectria estremocensis]|uniref:Carbonic anhydrase n=1 Tax=Dactylonectria estremocensis TaxID=1079267 RepID=A0A9P9E131_9HYPO|nr:carbonic anhydrase [Dactylonectria estremocensis]
MANHQLKKFLERNEHVTLDKTNHTKANGITWRSPSAASATGNTQHAAAGKHLHQLVTSAILLHCSRGLTAQVTCSDARVDPTEYFGLKVGEALVIRNAGGRATDAFRSLEVMGSIHPIDLIVVVHHTDCGGLFITEAEIRSKLSNRAPDHASAIKHKWFGTFRDVGLDESIRQDVEEIRQWPFLQAEAQVVGYALDIETGVIREVAPSVT